MSATATDQETELRANELYWSSARSVNQIAEDLDLSKGVLYGLIRPLPASLTCPDCADELVYPNRTARDRGLVACPACAWEGEEEEGDMYGADGTVAPMDGDEEGLTSSGDRLRSAWADTRTRTALGGALLGAAAGLAYVIWKRRH